MTPGGTRLARYKKDLALLRTVASRLALDSAAIEFPERTPTPAGQASTVRPASIYWCSIQCLFCPHDVRPPLAGRLPVFASLPCHCAPGHRPAAQGDGVRLAGR